MVPSQIRSRFSLIGSDWPRAIWLPHARTIYAKLRYLSPIPVLAPSELSKTGQQSLGHPLRKPGCPEARSAFSARSIPCLRLSTSLFLPLNSHASGETFSPSSSMYCGLGLAAITEIRAAFRWSSENRSPIERSGSGRPGTRTIARVRRKIDRGSLVSAYSRQNDQRPT